MAAMPSTPDSSTARARSTVRRVLGLEMLAITGTRPATWSTTVSMVRTRSASGRAGELACGAGGPDAVDAGVEQVVDPAGGASAVSTLSSPFRGVRIGTIMPWNFLLAGQRSFLLLRLLPILNLPRPRGKGLCLPGGRSGTHV